MDLSVQKRLAADVLGCAESNVRFEESRLSEIKEAITKTDLRTLANQGAIYKLPIRGSSKVRTRLMHAQKAKGRRRGHGSHKGVKTARTPKKRTWINRVRKQRDFLKSLREGEHITGETFRMLYDKSRGGFFRSHRHIKLYIDEHNLIQRKK